MSFPRYPKYRDSGVEWLGEIPAHWEISSIRGLARPGKDGFGDGDWIESPFITDDGIRLIQTGNVGVGRYREQGYRFISYETFDELGCTAVCEGDVLICRLADPVGRACLAPALGSPMITSVDVAILKTASHVDPEFVVYLMSSAPYLAYLESQCRGGTRDRVARSFLGSVRVPLPELSEQRQISAFLAAETGQIDRLIAEQEHLIELLKEKRQAAISHAVTKGLDPVAPMKPSGIEWLGDVPAHWRAMPIRKAARLESGHTPSRSHPEYWTDTSIPWFTLSDVWQVREGHAKYVYETKEKVSEVGLANSSARLLPAGTVMLSRTASVGFSTIMGVDMATTQDFANWVPGSEVTSEFLLYALRSMEGEFRRLKMGSTHNTIYMPDIHSLQFALPPLDEQMDIVAQIRQSETALGTLTDEANRAITLLNERRTALISAAVTGQIDVTHLTERAA